MGMTYLSVITIACHWLAVRFVLVTPGVSMHYDTYSQDGYIALFVAIHL